MFSKLGLVILIVLFGACTFVAGTMAPAAWRQPIAALGQRLAGIDAERNGVAAAGTAALAHSPSAAAATRVADVASSAASSGSSGPVPLDTLLVGAALAPPKPAKGAPAYALQLGQFVAEAQADAAMRHAAAALPDVPRVRLATVDAAQRPWSVVALGRFVSPEAAARAAPHMQEVLGLRNLPVIRLPPPEQPASGKTAT